MQAILGWYQGFIQGRKRVFLGWVFVFYLTLFVDTRLNAWGVLIAFLGASLRFWASGYIQKDHRLTYGGPYRFVRNPLYLGTYLMGGGVLLSVQAWSSLLIFLLIFFVVYHFIILEEEIKLKKIFLHEYDFYYQSVPRFFPICYKKTAVFPLQKFSWKVAMQNKAYEAFVSFFGIYLFIFLMSYWNKVLPF